MNGVIMATVALCAGASGQWQPLSVERIESVTPLRVLSNTSQTVSRCGPGWVLAGYATTSSPATIMYGDGSGLLGSVSVPYCYGIHGRGNRLAFTSSVDKVLHIMTWNGAAWVEGCTVPLADFFPGSWPYHVYIADNGAILVGEGSGPLTLVA